MIEMLIKNGLVFTESGRFEPLTVVTDNGRTSMLLPPEAMIKYSGEVVDAEGCFVLPGLCDIHLHGCMGHDFCEGTAAAIDAIAEYEYSQGAAVICPATMTLPDSELERILKAAAGYKAAPHPAGRAELAGVHLEGPFISPAKKGAQKGEHIQAPSAEKLRGWQEASGGLIRLVTIAPELEGAIECIAAMRGEMRFSLGHTESDYETAAAAFEAGAAHITHMYNAMPPFSHRAPGVIGAAFDREGCFAELICDGVHTSPCAVRAAYRLFGEDRLVLISDSMEAAGMPEGEYQLGGQKVYVKGDRACLADGTIAGSVTSIYKCMQKAVEFGLPLEAAVKAAAVNPCRSIGIDREYGSIAAGKRTPLLLADRETLALRAVLS